MAEINNALALAVKSPEFDLTTPLLTAAKLRSADNQDALTQLTIKDKTDGSNALSSYTAAKQAGDPNADNALLAHPEIYRQVIDLRKSLSDEHKTTLENNLAANARGAQRVMSITDPDERAAAWKEELDASKKRGLDDATYKRLSATPPNDLVLNNVIRQALTLEQYMTQQQRDRTRDADAKAAPLLGGKPPAEDAAPVVTPRAPVGPTSKVWGDKEAEDAGLYDPKPATAIGPTLPAATNDPAAPVAVAAVAPATTPIPQNAKPGKKEKPDDTAAITTVAANPDLSPATRAVAMELLKNRLAGDKTKISDDIAQRQTEVEARGMDPKNPQVQQFILTGKYPREDAQPLTATDKKAIYEADEGVMSAQTAISNLKQAKVLSVEAFEGPSAGLRGYVASLWGNKGAEKTQELDNLVTANALSQLKSIFGAAPTEGERKILLDIQGSVGKTDTVRRAIYDRAIQLAERRLDFNKTRADELRGGEFYKKKPAAGTTPAAAPGTTAAPAAGTTATPAPAAPSELPALPPGFQLVPGKKAEAEVVPSAEATG